MTFRHKEFSTLWVIYSDDRMRNSPGNKDQQFIIHNLLKGRLFYPPKYYLLLYL